MRKKVEFVVAILFLMGLIVVSKNVSQYVTSTEVEAKKNLIVIDPGHGGEDPGKVGINKALEKDVNLAIALQVKALLEKEKIEVVLTRAEDVMLSRKEASNKKLDDMKERIKVINKATPELVVSIHQNSYHQEEIWGAQVFYYTHSKEGESAAGILQQALLSCNQENKRQAKANDTYYLLKRTEVPTVIVEAGFLSNYEEAEKLVTLEYQEKVSEAVCAGVLEYLGL